MTTYPVMRLSDNTLQGAWRAPYNIAADAEGSIHNDDTARELGLEGGWIAGSIHMEQFVPLLIARFGLAWLERGGFSVYFRNATLSGQEVRASLSDGGGTARLAMQDRDERLVLDGEAWLGTAPQTTTLHQRMARFADDQAGPLLKDVSPGKRVIDVPSMILPERLAKDLPTITEPIEAYDNGVLPPNLAIDTLRAVEPELIDLPDTAIGLYGGIELQMIDGPLLAGTNYLANGSVLRIGRTPKSEVLFYASELYESDMLVARMTMMSRLMSA